MTAIFNFCHVEVTKNLKFYTSKKHKIKKHPKSLKLERAVNNHKPLVVMFSWMLAERKHLMKIAKFYIDQDFDVVIAHINVWQLLYPTKGSQKVAGDLVEFLLVNDDCPKILLHGFSIGGYLWSECLIVMDQDRVKYRNVFNRIVGQIWDSAADIIDIRKHGPKAIFPNNLRLENLMRNYMNYHFETFYELATKHYFRASQAAFDNFIQAPALFYVSKNDLIGDEPSNRRVSNSWIANGTNVTWKCFDNSPHVGHFFKHREEYLRILTDFLIRVGLKENSETLKSKI